MAASQFQWNADGSAIITVNGKTYRVQAGALTPGQPITVGGVQVGVPPRPQQPAPVLPFLTPEQQAQVNDAMGKFDEILTQADLAKKNADIQLNQFDLPTIKRNYELGAEGTVESMAGRGLSISGIRDSALLDVQYTKTMNDRAAQAKFDAAQAAADAAVANVNIAKGRLDNWIIETKGANAVAANADIPPVQGPNVNLTPYKAPAAPGAPGQPGSAPANPAPQPRPTYALPTILPGQPTKPGVPAPKTQSTLASGPPPGPDYVWTGNRWVKMGTSYGGQHGLGPSGSPPGPNYYWNGVKWVKVAGYK